MNWKEALLKRKGQIYFVVLLLSMFIVYECRKQKAEKQWEVAQQERKDLTWLEGKTMGTYYSIAYADTVNYQHEIDSVLKDFDKALSTYRDDSEISQFNQGDSLQHFSPFFLPVLKSSKEVYEATSGAFDPTVLPLYNAWGFGMKKNEEEPTPEALDSIKNLVGYNKVHFNDTLLTKDVKGLRLDFSAIAKGYGVDVVAEFLKSKGITSYKVEIGGEILCGSPKPNGKKWAIGIEQPKRDGQAVQQVLNLENVAIATSGNYRNYVERDGKRYGHTIDPVLGRPVQHELLSATVFAKDCMTADAYATAFMVLGMEESKKVLEQHPELDALFIYDEDGKYQVWESKGVNAYRAQ